MRAFVVASCLIAAASASAQFVFPKPGYHDHDPAAYKEDPFVTEYRTRYFSVFKGDFATFHKAYAEIQNMVKKNPKDARALVWLGTGQTVEAGALGLQGKIKEAKALLPLSRETMDKAVALRPKDPNIYMMRAVTLYIQGQYWASDTPLSAWSTLRDDCLRFISFLGPKLPKMSVHVRGETYGELGIAYEKLGDKKKAVDAFQEVISLAPGTEYETRAKKEIEGLQQR
jgi:tetratricopeptide (TPR) repeat protein